MAPLTRQELDDLFESMMGRMHLDLLPALTRANRTGELGSLLASLGMSDLLKDNDDPSPLETGKIIVLGASRVPIDKLRSIARKEGIDPNRLEFQTEYERLKHFDFGKIRGSMGYVAIFAGPMPHSTPGTADASSFIANVESNPDGYPQLFKLGTQNELKITNNSFRSALREFKEQFSQESIRYDSNEY